VGRCDAKEECDGSSVDCPPDLREPSGTVCRDDEGICDVAEVCNGVSTICPADAFEPEGTACDDGVTCTVNDECVAGVCTGDSMTCSDGAVQASCNEECDDGNTTNDDGCDDACHLEPCKPTPDDTCTQPFVAGKASIKLKHDPAKEEKDSVLWKWSKGSLTDKLEFGDPVTGDDYWLCIYDDGALVSTTHVPFGGTCDGADCWSEKSNGFQRGKRQRVCLSHGSRALCDRIARPRARRSPRPSRAARAGLSDRRALLHAPHRWPRGSRCCGIVASAQYGLTRTVESMLRWSCDTRPGRSSRSWTCVTTHSRTPRGILTPAPSGGAGTSSTLHLVRLGPTLAATY
jgi:cysteine-rich repeat protein